MEKIKLTNIVDKVKFSIYFLLIQYYAGVKIYKVEILVYVNPEVGLRAAELKSFIFKMMSISSFVCIYVQCNNILSMIIQKKIFIFHFVHIKLVSCLNCIYTLYLCKV